jgi:glycosyltransferase involved in cell wall biosynthesis
MATSEPSKSLRVLVIDEYFPYPPDSGKPIRTGNLLRRLSERHDVTLLCYGAPSAGTAVVPQLKVEFVEPLIEYSGIALYARLAANLFSRYPYSVTKHYTSRFLSHLQESVKSNPYDLIQCEWTPYARYLESVRGLPSLIASHNVESQIWSRRAEHADSVAGRAFFGMQAKKMETFERGALRDASWVTAVSREDANIIRKWGVERVSVVDNGVDLGFYNPEACNEDDSELLFLASLDWAPNVDGLKYFLAEVLPLIVAKEPKARVTIAGRKPPADLRKYCEAMANTNFVGEVPDVRPYLERAAVILVPLRVGGGSRLKILEAMAAGKAIVSTSVGAEGLAVTNNQQLILADDPRSFADAATALMHSAAERRRLGKAGRELVEDKYSWDECARKLEAAWFQAAKVGSPAFLRKGAGA